MATEAQEMEDLAKVSGALLINIGTLKSEVKTGMIRAGMCIHAIYVVK
jgi:thiamine-phosphate diphosphorylase/hydroxyethylthiazole kinase